MRFDNLEHYQQPKYYYRYNARGDAAGMVQQNGDGGNSWRTFGAWGDVNYTSDNKGYYNWNAAWGYMAFPAWMNFNAHDVTDVGLYYAHGRWYNQDTGLWLSPNEKGDYLYGGDGQDPVNKGFALNNDPWWRNDACIPGCALYVPPHPAGTKYIQTANYGYIDTSHLGGYEMAQRILYNLENSSDYPLTFTEREGVSLPWGLGTRFFNMTFQVIAPIPENLRHGVALAMFLSLESGFESDEAGPVDYHETNFAIEDLPSDYLGFYLGTQVYSCHMQNQCLDPDSRGFTSAIQVLNSGSTQLSWGSDSYNSPPRCNIFLASLVFYGEDPTTTTNRYQHCYNQKNHSWNPKVIDPSSGEFVNVSWPADMNITPIFDSSWSVVRSEWTFEWSFWR